MVEVSSKEVEGSNVVRWRSTKSTTYSWESFCRPHGYVRGDLDQVGQVKSPTLYHLPEDGCQQMADPNLFPLYPLHGIVFARLCADF